MSSVTEKVHFQEYIGVNNERQLETFGRLQYENLSGTSKLKTVRNHCGWSEYVNSPPPPKKIL